MPSSVRPEVFNPYRPYPPDDPEPPGSEVDRGMGRDFMRDAGHRTRFERYTLLPSPVEPRVWRLAEAPGPAAFFFSWGGTRPAVLDRDDMAFGLDRNSPVRLPFRGRQGATALAWVRAAAPIAEDEDDSDDDSTLSVCGTALYDRTKRESEPGRFVETTELPFLTLGTRKAFRGTGARLGDLATVVHAESGRCVHAILGDAREVVGAEPSLFLSEALALAPGDRAIYLIHPESGLGQGTIPTRDQIARRGERRFRRPPASDLPAWDVLLADCFRETLRADIFPGGPRIANARGA